MAILQSVLLLVLGGSPEISLRRHGAAMLLVLLGGCFGAHQVSPDNVQTVGGLTPSVEDKDAGLVGLAPGLDIKTYTVIAVDKFPVTDPAIKDDDEPGRESRRDGVQPRQGQDAAARRGDHPPRRGLAGDMARDLGKFLVRLSRGEAPAR